MGRGGEYEGEGEERERRGEEGRGTGEGRRGFENMGITLKHNRSAASHVCN